MACIETDILTLYRDTIYIKEQQNEEYQLYWSSHNKTSVLNQLSCQIYYMLPGTSSSDVLYASWNCLVRCTVCFLELPCQMYCMLPGTALPDVLYASWNCLARCTVCFLELPRQMYCMLPWPWHTFSGAIYIRSSNFITIYMILTYFKDITYIILNTAFKILSYNMYVSVLHNALVKFCVSTCYFVSNSLIMAQLGCKILEIHYKRLRYPTSGCRLSMLQRYHSPGFFPYPAVSSAWVLPKWWVFRIQKTHSALDSTTW